MSKHLIGKLGSSLNGAVHEAEAGGEHHVAVLLLYHPLNSAHRISLRNAFLIYCFGPRQFFNHEPRLIMGMRPSQVSNGSHIDEPHFENIRHILRYCCFFFRSCKRIHRADKKKNQ